MENKTPRSVRLLLRELDSLAEEYGRIVRSCKNASSSTAYLSPALDAVKEEMIELRQDIDLLIELKNLNKVIV